MAVPQSSKAKASPRRSKRTGSDRPVSARRKAANPGKGRGADKREAILAAALDEFSSRGFAATRLEDVAKRGGVAKGTIYLYFHDKESLFQELIRAMLIPVVGTIEALGETELTGPAFAERMVDVFVSEIFQTRRKDVIRLMITEGRRFPKLAEFYYREVLSHVIAALRATLRRAATRGQAPKALVNFPQMIAAPGLVAIIWSDLFGRFEPLDVRAMMKASVDLLFASGRAE